MDIPNEILYIILYHMDGFERENMRLVCKMFNEFKFDIITDNPERDREVKLFNYGSLDKLFEYGHTDIINKYINIYPYMNNELFIMACKHNSVPFALVAMGRGSSNYYAGLMEACKYGSLNIVKFIMLFIKHGREDAFRVACRYNQTNIIDYIYGTISKGAAMTIAFDESNKYMIDILSKK